MKSSILKSSVPSWVKRDEITTPTSTELKELFDTLEFTRASSNRLSVDVCFTIRTSYQNTIYVRDQTRSAHFRTPLKQFLNEEAAYYCGLLSIKEFLDKTFNRNYTQYMINSSIVPIGVSHMDKSLILYFHIVLKGNMEKDCFHSPNLAHKGVFESIESFSDKPIGRKFDQLIAPTLKIIKRKV